MLERNPRGLRFAGWAYDPDTPATAVSVHAYIDGVLLTEVIADRERTDVGAAYPPAGLHHGFDATVNPPPGHHQVCVYAINTGPGGNSLINCETTDA